MAMKNLSELVIYVGRVVSLTPIKGTDYPTVNSLSRTDIKKIFESLLCIVTKFIRITQKNRIQNVLKNYIFINHCIRIFITYIKYYIY